mmetsp:Transcript_58970/g.125286  ORF Transcript_58970/g.125286 Transcript_58970/m.125286 type:complete len:246 (-) Transcript_58970:1271-2008(-)
MRHLQHRPSLDQQPVHGPYARPDHDGGGSGQPQGTGTRYDHHANRAHERRDVPLLRGDQLLVQKQHPARERDRRQHHHARREHGSYPIRLGLYRRLVPLRLVHQPHDAGEDRLRPRGGHAEEYDRELVDAGAVERVSGGLGHGEGLPREGRLVDVGAPSRAGGAAALRGRQFFRVIVAATAAPPDDLAAPLAGHEYAVGGDASPRQDQQVVAYLDLGNILLLRAERVHVHTRKHLENDLIFVLRL